MLRLVTARSFVLGSLCIATQGCATALGSGLGERRQDRPGFTGELRSAHADARGFGGNRIPASVPPSIPLPSQADPRRMFTLPNIGNATTNALYYVGNGISILLVCVPDLSGKSPRECAARADHNYKEITPAPIAGSKGPVILR